MPCLNIPVGLAPLVGEGCPLGDWRADLASVIAPQRPVLLLVGANKGYNIVDFLQLWDEKSPTSRQWHAALRSHNHSRRLNLCGVCGECKAVGASAWLRNRTALMTPHARRTASTPHVHALDLLPQNRALLRHVVRATGVHDLVTVHDVAAAAETGDFKVSSRFSRSSIGFEQASLCQDATCRGGVAVRSVSIDDLVQSIIPRHHSTLKSIYQLTIDAEGWDAEILHGARRTLLSRRIQLVEFEFHSHDYFCAAEGNPRCKPLGELLAWLKQSAGYECFWQTRHRLVAASGNCWQPHLAEHVGVSWANLLCAHDARVLARIADRWSATLDDLKREFHRNPRGMKPKETTPKDWMEHHPEPAEWYDPRAARKRAVRGNATVGPTPRRRPALTTPPKADKPKNSTSIEMAWHEWRRGFWERPFDTAAPQFVAFDQAVRSAVPRG